MTEEVFQCSPECTCDFCTAWRQLDQFQKDGFLIYDIRSTKSLSALNQLGWVALPLAATPHRKEGEN
jgi:hypothetical protein